MKPGGNIASLARLGALLAAALVISGCTKGGQFDPTELLNSDTFDAKKKLVGQREPLFPNGVPGAATGVPPELIKGYQPPEAADNDAADAATAGAPPSEKPKPQSEAKSEAKPKPKPKVARAAAPKSVASDPAFDQKPASKPTRITVGTTPKSNAPAQQSSDQSIWPAPPPTSPPQQAAGSQSIWPAPPPASPPQQTAQPSQSIWPDPPAPAKN